VSKGLVGSWGFGIVPSSELQDAGRMLFEELCERASDEAGVRFSPVVATSYRDLLGALERRELGIAWMPPVPTIELVESKNIATPLAIPARRGRTTYRAALIVRRGGPKTIGELRGRRAAWVERDSAAGYLVPRMQLAAQGHDVLRFFSRELFVHSHPAVVEAVASGEADVGATYCHMEAATNSKKIARAPWTDDDGRSLRPIEAIATFGPIPNDALVGSTELPVAARASITRWLLDLDPRARDLFERILGAHDFRVPSPDHFDALRHALRAARARGHDAMPPESRRSIRAARRF
jgi:phosphonate transport system substrate-binding protein